jgi:hypothetical protein
MGNKRRKQWAKQVEFCSRKTSHLSGFFPVDVLLGGFVVFHFSDVDIHVLEESQRQRE